MRRGLNAEDKGITSTGPVNFTIKMQRAVGGGDVTLSPASKSRKVIRQAGQIL